MSHINLKEKLLLAKLMLPHQHFWMQFNSFCDFFFPDAIVIEANATELFTLVRTTTRHSFTYSPKLVVICYNPLFILT